MHRAKEKLGTFEKTLINLFYRHFRQFITTIDHLFFYYYISNKTHYSCRCLDRNIFSGSFSFPKYVYNRIFSNVFIIPNNKV